MLWSGEQDRDDITLSKNITLFKNIRVTIKLKDGGSLGGDIEITGIKNIQEFIKEKAFAVDFDGGTGSIKFKTNTTLEISVNGSRSYLKNIVGINF